MMLGMRTTVTLEPDIEALLRTRMREQGITFKEAINQALRSALSGSPRKATRGYRLKTYAMGFQPEFALDKALSLAAEAEDEEIVRKLSLRK